ncbi:Triosephosphate isomerase [Fulvivirga imtechensis AK7]|uniref:Triosephosphate isomerase n=1 Tax=Fulvivirga imtechensis AK7 TaxID=1237149 RepID=L8JNT6_9BACT|nr:triose-phosphate isomerase [Fulvivirga imtechensis]ELR69833.1 Triosephosphate isomerase [Fulvivirga imtechensis AK7]
MRQKIVAGNWKMNNTLDEGLKLTSEIINMISDEVRGDVTVVLAPSFVHLTRVKSLIKDTKKVHLAAQNCSEHTSGAYTGEVSAPMLASVGVEYVIIGHSERREYFNETNEQLARKVDIALANDLIPIFCCGEALEVRENGLYHEFVCNQVKDSLFHLHDDQFSKVVIAYEPIWAIGTGKTASSDQAQEMHATLREYIGERYGTDIAEKTPILYGGSCKPDNAKELFACKDVDGGLIGGASLKSRDFTDIIKSF